MSDSEYLPMDAAPLDYVEGQPEFDVGEDIDLTTFPEPFRNPRIAPGSHIKSAREVIALELEVEKAYNTLFLEDPEAMARKFYSTNEDRHMFDVVTPSGYEGPDLYTYWGWVSPQFDGRIEQTDIYAFADQRVAWVRQNQVYDAENIYTGDRVRWVMRQTDGLIKMNGEWRIAHTHLSWPADINTMVADMFALNEPRPWTRESYRFVEDRQVVDGKVIVTPKTDTEPNA